jgi:PAS domain S-box-containing protein
VPREWEACGVARAAVRRLPGDAGLLILAWHRDAAARTEHLDVVLKIVDVMVAGRQVEERMADLVGRVDNAQQLANMGDYDWHIASDTNRWSDQLYRIYGYEPQSFNASYDRFLAHVHPDDRERIRDIHQHAYATGEPYQMIERIIRADGELRFLSSNGQVVRDDRGNPVRMRGTCIDVTDRVVAEQAREHAAARFRALVEACPDAIVVHDGDGQIVQANRHACDLLGGEPVGHALQEILLRTDAAGQAISAAGLDGHALCLDVTGAALSELEEAGLGAVFLRDATPRLEAEALAVTLREAQIRRRQALEINDNIVQGLTAAVLAMATGDMARSTGYLERTLSAARHMMNDWLDPLNGEEFKPGDLVRATASTLGDVDRAQGDICGAVSLDADLRYRVVVVDDHADVRELLCHQLMLTGRYDVIGEAGDGEEAIRVAADLQPDVIVLDLSMPRMDGLQALPLILDAAPGARVIVMSGFAQVRMAEQVVAAGAATYVEKGLRMDLPGVLDRIVKGA